MSMIMMGKTWGWKGEPDNDNDPDDTDIDLYDDRENIDIGNNIENDHNIDHNVIIQVSWWGINWALFCREGLRSITAWEVLPRVSAESI